MKQRDIRRLKTAKKFTAAYKDNSEERKTDPFKQKLGESIQK
jgi:hypothetical protein